MTADPAASASNNTLSGPDGPIIGESPIEAEGLRAAELEVQHELGRGGMGVVYLATQRCLGRSVAVKTLRPELAKGPLADKFEAEATVMGRLEHPGIPPVYLFGRDEAGTAYLAMKVVNGVEWSRLLGPGADSQRILNLIALRSGPTPALVDASPDEIEAFEARRRLRFHLRILRSVCEAVAFAHSRGIIHRDLKPGNVMLGEFGEVLVLDWGLAYDLGNPPPSPVLGVRRPSGTPAYIAPEMARCRDDLLGPATDVYLLGGILYEVLTGTPPHQGDGVSAVLLEAAEGQVEPPFVRAPERKIPSALSEIAMKALDPVPARRHESASAFAQAIDEYIQHESSVRIVESATAGIDRAEREIAGGAAAPHAVYGVLFGAIAALGQALEMWPANRPAKAALFRARLACASFALERGDLALAETHLADVAAGAPEAEGLRARLAELGAERAVAKRRRRQLLFGAIAAAGMALLAFLGTVSQHRVASEARKDVARRNRALEATRSASKSTSARVRCYREALAIDPDWVEGHVELAHALMIRARLAVDPKAAAADCEEALGPVDRAVALKPEDAEIRLLRAQLREVRGEWPEAEKDLAAILSLDPGSHPGRVAACELALSEGRLADAVTAAAQAIELPGGGGGRDHLHLAVARYATGDLDGSLAEAEKAAAEPSRDFLDITTMQAIALVGRGDRRAAADRVIAGLRANRRAPNLTGLLYYFAAKAGDLGRARALRAAASGARRDWGRAFLSLEPTWRALARAPAPLDEVVRAMMGDLDLEALLPREPAPSVRLRERAERRFAAGEVEGAFADTGQVIADDPLDGAARLLNARCFVALGHPDAAEHTLALVDILNPNLAAEVPKVLGRHPRR